MNVRERAYKYSNRIVNFLDALPNDMTGGVIAKQLMRSANERPYWLGLLRDAKGMKSEELAWLLQEGQELARIIGAGLLTIKGKR